MAAPASKRRATYQDVLDAPEHVIAEVIDGDLRLSPRPAGRHTKAHTSLSGIITAGFDLGMIGPGGWIILSEPELHLRDDIVVPDIGGWRRERMPEICDEVYFTLAPDWACEVLSRSTRIHDRSEKLPIYAREGVAHVWFLDPIQRTLEVLRLQNGKWLILDIYRGDAKVHAEPFDAIALDLALVWSATAPPLPRGTRASEQPAEYETGPVL